MPVARDQKVGKAKSAPSRPAPSVGNGGPSRKLGSLSSFQATLNFSILPQKSSSASTSTPARPSSSNGGFTKRNLVDDAKLMPPPPPGIRPKPLPSVFKNSGKIAIKAEEEVVEVLDSDEEDSLPKNQQSSRRVSKDEAHGDQMWTELYAPTTEAELAPGKKRIERVRNWLHEALYGHPQGNVPLSGGQSQASKEKIRKYKRILLLTGPAGTGKTTTVRLLAHEMSLELAEWEEGQEERSIGSGIERESSMSKMSSFLSRHSYAPLNMSSQSSVSSSSQRTAPERPRVLLLTALPNTSHLPTREAFHAALLQFCKTFTSTSCPLIIVHSDAGSGGRAEESWMDRDRGGREGAVELLGKDVRDGPWCTEIDFIPLAPTFVIKALNRVLSIAVPNLSHRPPSSAIQLIALSCNGDLRSAINSLQLLCSDRSAVVGKKRKNRNDDDETSPSVRKSSGKGSRGGKGSKLNVSEDLRAVLDAVTRREQSLNLFHALGKVFYNKRLGDPGIDDDDQEAVKAVESLPSDELLPRHVRHYGRTKSMVQMEAFLPTIPVDASSFALWVHQSFPSFCTDIEQTSNYLDELCFADVLRTDDDIWQSSPQAIAYSLHLTVRGALMALPSPVPRNHQKILKPQFFAAFRAEKENQALLETAAGYLAKKAVASSVALSERGLRDDIDSEVPWGGVSSRYVLAAELLPMMVKLQGMTSRPLLPVAVRPLSLPPFFVDATCSEELVANDVPEEDDYESLAAGEDGLGTMPDGQGWDEEDAVAAEQEDMAWLNDDDIQDWD
ncbi:Rad17 cell cycle checkpoint protein-domain-containing protein [Naematelia encephala]|uniref:Rad17 cell cycle checkpoint protein-domain-containing protein n=1 Tax=Naematelia encephala TaxID=71784 RepID=A0A1Y2AE93_9TREE|nr:Rad17 cell cycle checkpoint protein-domain-containing protein [Naematelia encephala]